MPLYERLRDYQSGRMPGIINCQGTDPLAGDWGRHCSLVAWSEGWQSYPMLYTSVDSAHVWWAPSSNQQAGWNRCILNLA